MVAKRRGRTLISYERRLVSSLAVLRAEANVVQYRIMVNGSEIPAEDQVYHQVGEMPWRLTVGATLRIADRSYVVNEASWNQSAQELAVTARLVDNPIDDRDLVT